MCLICCNLQWNLLAWHAFFLFSCQVPASVQRFYTPLLGNSLGTGWVLFHSLTWRCWEKQPNPVDYYWFIMIFPIEMATGCCSTIFRDTRMDPYGRMIRIASSCAVTYQICQLGSGILSQDLPVPQFLWHQPAAIRSPWRWRRCRPQRFSGGGQNIQAP